jgi:hypothetical protein
MKCEVPKGERIVWATEGSRADRWRTIDREVNFVDHFGVSWGEVLKSSHQDSRNCEVQNPDGMKSC